MTRRTWIGISIVIAVGALILLGRWIIRTRSYDREHLAAEALVVESRFVSIDVEEPSGIAYHPTRDTLLVASDEGSIVELDRKFQVIRRFELEGDLEGVAVHPLAGTIFVASENDNSIIEYDLGLRRTLRRLTIDVSSHPDLAKGLSWNRGIEGVAVGPGRQADYTLFAVIESGPARLLELSADLSMQATIEARNATEKEGTTPIIEPVRIVASHDLGLSKMSGLLFDTQSGEFLVTSSGPRTLTVASLAGRRIRTVRLPGKWPEGFCFLPNGDAIVAHDTGGLWVCERMRQALWAPSASLRD